MNFIIMTFYCEKDHKKYFKEKPEKDITLQGMSFEI